jgi:hypothetical protein
VKQKAKTISKAQRLQLIGLRTVAAELNKQLDAVRDAAVAITGEKDAHGEPEGCGHTYDYVIGDYRGIDEMLRLVNVRVLK